MNKIIFLCFGALIFFSTKKVESKFENIKDFLLNFELSEISELKRQFTGKSVGIKNAEKSIELKAFGKTFVIDLCVYYPEEDVAVVYIASGSPSTSSFLDSNLLIYYGSVRDVKDSFAVGSFDANNLFRGYVVTDDAYCVEPHLEENATVIVYKMSDVIYPGCSKSGEELDCTQTKFYAPWIPENPQMKNYLNYHWFYSKYQELLRQFQAMKTNFKERNNRDNSDEEYEDSDNDTEYHNDEPKTWSSNKNKKSFLYKRAKDDIKGLSDADNSPHYITYNNITNHFSNVTNFRSLKIPYENSKLENISKIAISKGQKNVMDSIFEKFSYPESRVVWKEISPNPIAKMSLALGKDILDSVTIERLNEDPAQLECDLEIVFGPSMSKKFNSRDDDLIKDIFTQITLVREIFRKLTLPKEDRPAQMYFKIGQITVYGDSPNPFSVDGNLKHFAKTHIPIKQSCLVIGLVNKFLPMGEIVNGNIPEGGGGACAEGKNNLMVSHGNSKHPLPMALSFAALMRGLPRALGANDEFFRCTKGPFPNPMQVLRDYLLAKVITPGMGYSIFTECNVEEITSELHNKRCLVPAHEPFCGNGILDAGEECDCGPVSICKLYDPCCASHHPHPKSEPEHRKIGCKLEVQSNCSNLQPCCLDCDVSVAETQCVSGPGLCDFGVCDGVSEDCPVSTSASDGMLCEGEADPEPLVCNGGNCDMALCKGNGFEPCSCSMGSGKECVFCCLSGGKCQAAGSELELMKGKDQTLPDGAECVGGTCQGGKCNRLQQKFPHLTVPKSRSNAIFTTLYFNACTAFILLMFHFAWSY